MTGAGMEPPARAAIVAAAARLIREKGSADAVTVDQITTAAGVARATLYRHFRGKDEVVRAVASQGLDIGEAPGEERRQRILEAALRAAARWGFRGATMERIGQEAGISAGTIYWYFDSKEALLAALLETYSALPRLRQIKLQPPGDEQSQLAGLAENVLAIFEQRVDVIKTVISEAFEHPEIAQDFYREVSGKLLAHLVEYVDQRVAAGVFRPGHSHARALALISALLMYAIARRNVGEILPVPRDVAVREYVDLFLHGVAQTDIPRREL